MGGEPAKCSVIMAGSKLSSLPELSNLTFTTILRIKYDYFLNITEEKTNKYTTVQSRFKSDTV